ncbi:MAG: hypothetical protein S4CHLAM7_14560 [Chlamydiae bacterium]|nr:hypothetical protein [Chlamydiota bacterium]
MPTYEYKCCECEYVYEVFHKISQEPLKECPKCHKETLQRGIGGQNAVLNFKGSGFYITDYTNQSASAPKAEKKDSKKTSK